MSLVFGSMLNELTSEAFKDNEFKKISKKEFDIFYKEFIFEKLKGKSLGASFAKNFNVKDRVLYMFSQDKDALTHIKQWYVK